MHEDTVVTEEKICFWTVRFLGMKEDQQICSNHQSDYYDDFVPLHCKKCNLFREE
jgi:hypothetical protein